VGAEDSIMPNGEARSQRDTSQFVRRESDEFREPDTLPAVLAASSADAELPPSWGQESFSRLQLDVDRLTRGVNMLLQKMEEQSGQNSFGGSAGAAHSVEDLLNAQRANSNRNDSRGCGKGFFGRDLGKLEA
jgi:hypothetical protein